MLFVYSPDSSAAGGSDDPITYREAVRQTIRTAMKDDERVFAMGGTSALRRLFQREHWAFEVRAGADSRHPLSSRLSSAGDRAALGRYAPSSGDDGQLQLVGPRPDREHPASLSHVRWPVQRSGGHS